jgi:hypothetical protein
MIKGQLLFVYNAKSNLFNKAFDFVHKMVSPQSYHCNLCLLTHTDFFERKEWTDFRTSLSIDLKFLYSDNFEHEFPMERTDYPVVYLKSDIDLKKLITTKEVNSVNNPKELIKLVKEKLKA